MSERMSGVDTAWLRMERPTNRMMITGVLMLAGTLDHARVKALLAERFLAYRRFRQKAVVGVNGAHWVVDEDFDLDWLDNAARIDELVPEGKVDIHRDKGAYCYVGYRHSFCHGWASGPTAWLSEHVLGVEVLGAGCKKVRITPHLGDLEWAEGTFPTPKGTLKVRHQKQANGNIKTTYKAPKGVKVVVTK